MTLLPRVSRRNRCPICGQDNWCGFTSDGSAAICMRVPSPIRTKQDGFIHPLNEPTREKIAKKVSLAPISAPVFRRDPEEIDEVYTAFLEFLSLARLHERDLEKRGLGKVAINLHGYKSMPGAPFRRSICRELSKRFDLRGVPGFFTKGGEWCFVNYRAATGYLIPIRNQNHQICAVTLRRDDDRSPKYLIVSSSWQADGTPSGTPAHFATVGKIKRRRDVREIIVTEGALKANVASALLDAPVVGLLSVTTFNEFFPVQLKETFPKLEDVKIAFDMDAATNAAVKAQRTRLSETLRAANLKPSIITWQSHFKGIDDYLLWRSKESENKNQRIAA